MRERLRNRYFIIGVLLVILFGLLIAQLGRLTLSEGQEYYSKSEERKQRTITLKGQRGRILDRNGLLLAFNQKSFDIQFFRDPAKRTDADRALYTEAIMKTIEIVEKSGGRTVDTFAIRRNDQNEYAFVWDVTSEAAVAAREKNWRSTMYVDKADTPEQLYNSLRKTFQIPESLSYDEAIKVLSIWQDVQMKSYKAYEPVTVAYNVSMEVVSEVETRSMELDGMATAESTVRIYPKGSSAAHIVGYLGRIFDDPDNPDKVKQMQEAGYALDDTVGHSGIEATMENYLTGNTKNRQGSQLVEVNIKNKVTQVIETQMPTNGDDVVLTIDLHLQQKLEEALEKNIKEINAKQRNLLIEKEEFYKSKRSDLSTIKLAEYGSAVVIDIKTAEVLAMANYPSYDANLFTGGISKEVYKALIEDKTHLPLFNKAISSKGMPGSIFKMVTGLAGLEEQVVIKREGLPDEVFTADTKIDDEGPYTAHTTNHTEVGAPRCWTSHPENHNGEDIVKALKDSCNYYFFTVADALGIDRLNKWATKLGLDSRTGIELLGETKGQIGGQNVIYDNTKPINQQQTELAKLVAKNLKELLRGYCVKQDRVVDEGAISTCTERLIRLVSQDEKIGDSIRVTIREELGIPEAITKNNYWDVQVSSMLTELRWNPNQTVRAGIGQAVTLVTPVAVARYMAALVNGGNVYDVSLVKRIMAEDGKTVEERQPKLFGELNANPAHLAEIKEGMREVVSPEDAGTAAEAFKDFEYANDIGGKTGTAQISTSANNIDIENTSWFVAFIPYEKPEIAIVVCIPNGLSGSSSATTVKEVFKFYMDRKKTEAKQNIPEINSLTQ